MSSSRGAIAFGKENIEFSFSQVDRKTLEIAVHPDQAVVIKAPLGIDIEEIQKRVVKRVRWISRQREFFRQFQPLTPPRQYLGGETHLYLGRRYSLKINRENQNAGARHAAPLRLICGYFQMTVNGNATSDQVKAVLEKWYAVHGKIKFRESFERCWPHFEKLSLTKPHLQIRTMKKRWGSLSGKDILTLNPDLIRAPRECIDYVVTHELCHLQNKNHGHDFFRLLEKVMPDWKKRKHNLELLLA